MDGIFLPFAVRLWLQTGGPGGQHFCRSLLALPPYFPSQSFASPLSSIETAVHIKHKKCLRINPVDVSIPKQDTDMSTLNFKSIHKGFSTFKHLILDLYSGAVRQGRFIFLDFLPISRSKFIDSTPQCILFFNTPAPPGRSSCTRSD